MGERTSYAAGAFSWTDLATTDPEAAKRFYGELFGWAIEDLPVPGSPPYSMARVDGKDVAAIYTQPEEQRSQGVPPNWASYVTVEDAEAVAGRAGELGGAVLAEAFDVMDAGRMAVIADPTGAVFCLWQPGRTIGAGLVNAHGALTLNQLNTSDPERAAEFYRGLFGWRIEPMEAPGPPYWGIYNSESLNGGMMNLPPDSEAPSHWLVYFAIDDLDRAAGQIPELGGQVVMPPMPVPAGRVLVARDPQGAYFALWSGQLDP